MIDLGQYTGKEDIWKEEMIVYCYTNKETGEKYVGQTIGSLRRRHYGHIRKPLEDLQYVDEIMREIGEDKFTLEILYRGEVQEELWAMEKFFIRELNTLRPNGYNISDGGRYGNTLAGKTEEEKAEIAARVGASLRERYKTVPHHWKGSKHTEETKDKMSESSIGEKNPMFGCKHSEETRAKQGANRGKVMSEEQRKKISESGKGKGVPEKVVQLDINTIEPLKVWPSGSEASRVTGIHKTCILKVCRGIRKTAGGFKWMTLAKYEEKYGKLTYDEEGTVESQ